MKAYFLFFLLLTVGLIYCSEDEKSSPYTRKCYVYEHEFEFGEPENKGQLQELRYYIDSFLVKKQFVNKRRRKRDYILYAYNDNGRLKVQKRFSRRRILLRHIKYRYDEQGRLFLRQEFDNNGKLVSKKEWIYPSDKKQWEEWSEYDRKGLKRKTVITAYDSLGRRLRGSIFLRNNKKYADFHIEERDSMGNEVLNVFYKPEGKLLTRIKREYNAQGRKIFEFYEGEYRKQLKYRNGYLHRELFLDPNTDEKERLLRYVYIKT